MLQYNDPHSYRSYYPIKVERAARTSFPVSAVVRAYDAKWEEDASKYCNILDKAFNWLFHGCDSKIDEQRRRQGEPTISGLESFKEKLTFIDPSGDVPAQTKAAPPMDASPPKGTPTTDTWNLNIFGKEIKIPKNLVYPAIGIVLVIILIIALRRR